MTDLPSRRAVLRGLGALALAAGAPALAACGSSSAAPLASGSVDLRFWTHDPGYAATFTKASKDTALVGDRYRYSLRITEAAATDLVSRAVAQAVADGSTPDLLGIEISNFPRVMVSGIAEDMFVDLTPATKPFGSDLLKTAPFTSNGRVFALESDNSISVLYYRHDEFDRLGLPEDLATWEDFAKAGASLHRKTGKSLGMVPVGDNKSIVNGYLQFCLQRGGTLFDANGDLALESSENVDTLSFMVDGLRSGFLLDLPDPYGSACAAALKQGKLIAIAMPNWYSAYDLKPNVPDQKNRWRIRVLPRFSGGGHAGSVQGGTGFAVVKDKANTQAALDLLKKTYLTRDGQILRYRSAGYMPTLAHLYEDPAFVNATDPFLGGQRVFDVYGELAHDLPLFHQAPGMTILVDVLGGHLLDAYQGNTSPAAALRAGVQSYHEQVKR
jgi:arabinosaccharide transport system substrate-binding protein